MSPARRRLLLAACGLVAALVGLDFFVEHHGAFGIDGTPGFAAWYGFAAAVASVIVAIGWAGIASRAGEPRDD